MPHSVGFCDHIIPLNLISQFLCCRMEWSFSSCCNFQVFYSSWNFAFLLFKVWSGLHSGWLAWSIQCTAPTWRHLEGPSRLTLSQTSGILMMDLAGVDTLCGTGWNSNSSSRGDTEWDAEKEGLQTAVGVGWKTVAEQDLTTDEREHCRQ